MAPAKPGPLHSWRKHSVDFSIDSARDDVELREGLSLLLSLLRKISLWPMSQRALPQFTCWERMIPDAGAQVKVRGDFTRRIRSYIHSNRVVATPTATTDHQTNSGRCISSPK